MPKGIRRSLTILLLTLNSIFLCYSQEDLSYYFDKANQFYQMGQYQMAIDFAELGRKRYKEIYGETSKPYANILNLIGTYHVADKNFEIAEKLFNEALKILSGNKKHSGTYRDYLTTFSNLCFTVKSLGDYPKAEYLYKQLLNEKEIFFGSDNPEYAKTLYELGVLCFETSKYKSAEQYLTKALKVVEDNYGKDHSDYITILGDIGLVYKTTGNYKGAESIYLEVLKLKEKLIGIDQPSYIISLNNLAGLYLDIGDYKKAIFTYIISVNIGAEIYNLDQPEYALLLNNLAVAYQYNGEYSKAKPLYIKTLEIRGKSLGESNPLYASTLSNVGTLYRIIGDYKKAEKLSVEAVRILKETVGPKHLYTARALNNLGVLYKEMADYSKTEKYFLEALELKKELFGPEHPDYINSLNNLGVLYTYLGKNEEARILFKEAINARKVIAGNLDPIYAQYLNNLSALYFHVGDYTTAEELINEVLNIREETLGEDHLDYAESLNILAVIKQAKSEYYQSETLYRQALAIIKYNIGKENTIYASTLSNLAKCHNDCCKHTKSDTLYLEALSIFEKIDRLDDPNYAISLTNTALFNDELGFPEKAESYFKKVNLSLKTQIQNGFTFLSEIEKDQFLSSKVNYYFDIIHSFIFRRYIQNPLVSIIAYNNEVTYKSMLLQDKTLAKQLIYSSMDQSLVSKYDDLISLKNQLSELYVRSSSELELTIDSLEYIYTGIEKALLRELHMNPVFNSKLGLTNIQWDDIQDNLDNNEAAVEFLNFRYHDGDWTDSTFYCALVLRKEYKYPKLVYLFEESQLNYLINTSKATTNASYISELYNYTSSKKLVNEKLAPLSTLYNLVWEPIDSLFDGINTVYLAPSGILNKVSFNAISFPDSTYLLDKYFVNFLMSTRQIAQTDFHSESSPIFQNAALYGGIKYDLDSTEILSLTQDHFENTSQKISYRNEKSSNSPIRYNWPYLPGTYSEVTSINDILEANGIKNSFYTGMNATEQSFKGLAEVKESPDILHIATHGFSYSDRIPSSSELDNFGICFSNSNIPSLAHSNNSLSRSGLLFAGANNLWKIPKAHMLVEDGVLTAYEVSNMDLSNTKLAILSACETGLGEIKGSEGVFGLQRGFKLAGVKYLLVSLWQVPDYQTSELMKHFYINMMEGDSIRGSFYKAQKIMSKLYNPYFWGAFILIE